MRENYHLIEKKKSIQYSLDKSVTPVVLQFVDHVRKAAF